ncbi:glycosyltransferase family 2 protein [Microvirga sp. BT688]|nr:glycosyltransferase family 2 protein [Microvirga sp.]
MQVAVVIVNYRTADLTIDCLKSLEASGDIPRGSQVVVVDGGSNDNSVSLIGSAIAQNGWADWVTLLPLDVNGGFAYANNRGIEAVLSRFGEPRFFWLLNPDTIVRPNALSNLLGFMEARPEMGVAGSRLEDPDETPQHSAFRFHSALGELESTLRLGIVSTLLKHWCVAPPIPDRVTRTDWVSGASMLIRSEVLDAVGMLDDSYFMYYEETDLCLRSARAGWECWYVPESRVVHLVGRSSGVTVRNARPRRRPGYWFASRRHYFVKNHGWAYAMLADLAWIGGQSLWRIRQALQKKPDNDPPNLLGDFIRQAAPIQKARMAGS